MVRLAYTLILVLLVVILVAVAEYAARLVGLGNPLLYYESPLYGYALNPDQHETRRRGAQVTIRSHGLRGTRDWEEPADLHLLFLGDSVTYGGSYIDDRETFAEQACVYLAARSSQDALCGNAGVNAYGTDNMQARLAYQPLSNTDAVIATVLPGDATRGMTRLKALPYFSKPPPGPVPALAEAVAFMVDRLRSSLRFQPVAYSDEQEGTKAARLSMQRLLAELGRERDRGRLVAVVYSPPRREMEGQRDALGELVRQSVSASDIPLIDMRDAIQGKDLDSVYYDAVHLDVAGHQLYGATIGAWLVAELTDQ